MVESGLNASSSSRSLVPRRASHSRSWTVDDVAALLKVSKSWVYEHTRSGRNSRSERLPYVKVGKYVRFEARALRTFIEKQCRTPE
jgi:excisionase family DNA binding protein